MAVILGNRLSLSQRDDRPDSMRQARMRPFGGFFPGRESGTLLVTFVNSLEQDRETLLAFKEFRAEAERKKFRYFLEVFRSQRAERCGSGEARRIHQ